MGTFNESYEIAKKHWEVLAYAIYKDGTKELIRNIDYNVVVENLSIAIACLMKGESGYGGVLYWALGTGLEAWPDDAPPSPSDTDTLLANEVFRKAITPSNIIFIDANNAPSVTPTNRLQITVEFLNAEANYGLKEFGLFAGNATASRGSGLMINHKTHPLIPKDDYIRLEYTLRLTF